MTSTHEARLPFAKMSGAGNDFILINASRVTAIDDPGVLAAHLCRRRVSVGADGLVLVSRIGGGGSDARIRVRFWNPDGEEVATCGNGTRCAARFAVLEELAPREMEIETLAGRIEADVDGEIVALRYETRPEFRLDFQVTGPEGTRRGHRVEVGNPHLVLAVERLPEGAIEPICEPLRRAPELGPAGANVHLVEVLDSHRIRIRTYERGVEAETLACGSGSMSSAVALAAEGRVESPVAVETRSGDVLVVRFARDEEGFGGLELEGPARLIYRGVIGGVGPE